MSTLPESVRSTIDSQSEETLEGVMALVAQPSISAQDVGIRECAALEMTLLKTAGLEPRLLETSGHPMVYAEWLQAPGKPTVLFYGHYDVQPPDPLDLWTSPPFEPEIRDGRIYGRGVADNKAQHLSHIAAIRAWMTATGGLPVNVKVLLEGEEEVGSPHLDEVAERYRDLLSADLVYTADGPITDERFPELSFGVRGLLYIELHATGPNRDLHSGHWGGVAPNPIWTLVRALNTMLDDNNHVLVDGFYENVLPAPPAARAAMDAYPVDVAKALAGIGLERMTPPDDLPFTDRIMAQPTMNLAGIVGGYGGPGSKTIVPSTAMAKIDMRLVPDQTPDEIWDKVSRHLALHAPEVTVRRLDGGMLPSWTPVDHPMAGVVRDAIETGFGSQPVSIPIVGGSLPDAVWTRTLGIPSFLVPYGAPEQANHSPNESYRVERLWQGIVTSAALLGGLADTEWPPTTGIA